MGGETHYRAGSRCGLSHLWPVGCGSVGTSASGRCAWTCAALPGGRHRPPRGTSSGRLRRRGPSHFPPSRRIEASCPHLPGVWPSLGILWTDIAGACRSLSIPSLMLALLPPLRQVVS